MFMDNRRTECFAYVKVDRGFRDECKVYGFLECRNSFKCPFYKEKQAERLQREECEKRASELGYETATTGGKYKPIKQMNPS